MLADRSGNIWGHSRTTGYNGIMRYYPGAAGRAASFVQLSTNDGMSANYFAAILQDKQGAIWMGNLSGLNRLEYNEKLNSGAVIQFTTEQGLVDKRIMHLFDDHFGNLWLGHFGGGLTRFELDASGKGGRFIYFNIFTTGEERGENSISGGLEDRQGNLWFGTHGWGMSRFRPDQDGTSGTITHFTTNEGLLGNFVGDIFEDSHGYLWVSTDKGVSRFAPKDADENISDGFTHFTFSRFGRIVEDKAGRIWLIGTDKIHVLLPVSGDETVERPTQVGDYQVLTFGKEDGFQRASPNGKNVRLDQQDRIWWPVVDGLTMLDPHQMALPENPPAPPQLFQVDIHQSFTDYRKLKNDPAYRDSLSFGKALAGAFDSVTPFQNYPVAMALPHHLNDLTFQFTAIDWAAPNKLSYSYFLEGVDDRWSPAGPENKADYRDLSPGHYTFKVKAVGAAGLWSEVSEYPFRIRPPWWAAWWAFLFYGALTLYLLYHLYRFLLARQLERSEIVRLQELDAFKTRLYTNITHEFRTPLTIILGMARQIKDDPQKWFDEGLQMIVRNGRQLFTLVNQMLDLSKLDKGKLQLKPQPGEMVGFIRYLIQSFESLAAGKDIQVHFLKEVDRLDMDFDPDQLTKVVSNLLSNAIKFTPAGGHVYLTVRTQDAKAVETPEELEIRVRDTGPGIPPAEQARIFDRFYQVSGNLSKEGEQWNSSRGGVGVGLALARELVQLMGGQISVQSTPGEGTEFNVLLPVKRSVPKEVALVHMGPALERLKQPQMAADTFEVPADVAEKEISHTANVKPEASPRDLPVALLIEDDRDVLTYLASCLDTDYQLEFATDGQAGIELALELVPDLIISDVMMPGKDGYEVCATLKDDIRTSHIPIILLTAKADHDSRMEGLKRGADAYLTKPFDKEELEIRASKLLELRSQLQAHFRRIPAESPLEQQPPTKEELFMQEIRRITEENLADESFGTVQLCREMAMSRSQLHNKLKALTGMPASLYIRAFRLEKAKQLLSGSDLNISEVAYRVGFRTPVYFTQAFSEVVGMAPSVFRTANP